MMLVIKLLRGVEIGSASGHPGCRLYPSLRHIEECFFILFGLCGHGPAEAFFGKLPLLVRCGHAALPCTGGSATELSATDA
jgi:hypothetical protein